MGNFTKINTNYVLVGDELGQIKLAQLDSCYDRKFGHHCKLQDELEDEDEEDFKDLTPLKSLRLMESPLPGSAIRSYRGTSSLDRRTHQAHRHRVIRILDQCLKDEPSPSRAITTIRPLENANSERDLDCTDRPNNLFLISNRIGQMYVCDTDAIRDRIKICHNLEDRMSQGLDSDLEPEDDCHQLSSRMVSPIYYNPSTSRGPICGGQPINQTNILVIYQNGDIQHVGIGQDVLQSSLKIKRKAIKMLGLGYDSDSRNVHWRIDGSTGICYVDSDLYMDKEDPLTKILLRSPTHKLDKRLHEAGHNLYGAAPCLKSRKFNAQRRLLPNDVLDKILSGPDYYGSKMYRLDDTILPQNGPFNNVIGLIQHDKHQANHYVTSYKLSGDRLALGGYRYSARVYDVQTQKSIYNCRHGTKKNPLVCPSTGEPHSLGDLCWIGGNKATKKPPDMLAICSGIDSVVNIYDLRSPKPAFHIDLTYETQDRWDHYVNQYRGATFISICASGAPYSTLVPSQQLMFGSTSGDMIVLDLRFVSKSRQFMGKLSGIAGGSIREMRFVTESFETSKLISCSSDRFLRVHKLQTSYTSMTSQKLATSIFLGSRPTCIQPICDELNQTYLTTVPSRCGSECNLSANCSDDWSLLGVTPQ